MNVIVSDCCFNEQAKELAKKRNAELQAENDTILASNRELTKKAYEIFSVKLEAAEKRMKELEKEMNHAKMHCIELEEKIRSFL